MDNAIGRDRAFRLLMQLESTGRFHAAATTEVTELRRLGYIITAGEAHRLTPLGQDFLRGNV